LSDPVTLAIAEETYAEFVSARSAVLKGQAYSIDGRSLTRASLAEINKQINFWRGEIIRIGTGRTGPMVKRGIPHG